jgi:NADH-quinone oxidoreductase subunit D
MAKTKPIKKFTLNFGPRHLVVHGVLRLILKMNGEVVEHATPHIKLF